MKRGISPLMAEIIMVALAIGIGAAVFAWFGGISKEHINKGNEKYASIRDCSIVEGELIGFFLYPSQGKVKVLLSSATPTIYPVNKIIIVNNNGMKCNIVVDKNIEPGKVTTLEGNCTIFKTCKDFHSLSIISPCINKNIFYEGKIISINNGKVCKSTE